MEKFDFANRGINPEAEPRGILLIKIRFLENFLMKILSQLSIFRFNKILFFNKIVTVNQAPNPYCY